MFVIALETILIKALHVPSPGKHMHVHDSDYSVMIGILYFTSNFFAKVLELCASALLNHLLVITKASETCELFSIHSSCVMGARLENLEQ